MPRIGADDSRVGRVADAASEPDAPIRLGFENEGFEMRTHDFHTPVWIDDRLIVWSGGTGLDGPGSPPDGVVFAPTEP